MKIIRLEAENFKRLRAVSIAPSGNVVEVTGGNGEGKTSTLDAIWAALGGKDAAPAKPIRTGEEAAVICLTIGEGDAVKLKVTRKFRRKEGVPYATDLIVESEEGARFSSPQGILDGLVGALCFDPLAFTRMKPGEQVRALRSFVPDVDFASIEGLNKRDFDERTAVNRRAKDLRAQIEALPVIAGDLPDRVDVAKLEAKLAEAAEHNSTIERRKGKREQAQARIENIAEEVRRLQHQIEQLNQESAGLAAELAKADPLPDPIDAQAVQAQLAAGRLANAMLDKADERARLAARAKEAEEESMSLTVAIAARKEEAAKKVASAKMPVAGLGFAEDDGGDPFVTLGAEPFEQASQAQKIRASVAVAAAMNPKLRVARIMDGSLLDAHSWAALEDYAREADLQVWVETVQQHGKAAVLIEDGGAVSAESEPHAEVAELGDVV